MEGRSIKAGACHTQERPKGISAKQEVKYHHLFPSAPLQLWVLGTWSCKVCIYTKTQPKVKAGPVGTNLFLILLSSHSFPSALSGHILHPRICPASYRMYPHLSSLQKEHRHVTMCSSRGRLCPSLPIAHRHVHKMFISGWEGCKMRSFCVAKAFFSRDPPGPVSHL